MQKKNKAALALGVSAGGFLATLPWAGGGFGWGLMHHGFLAATIGGLADWFAVTALFRRPLGIAYRTEILKRNRSRIMESIVDFASGDLLSVKNVMGVVAEEDTASLLVDYLKQRGGRERLKSVIRLIALKGADTADTKRIAAALAPAVQEGLNSLALGKTLADSLNILAEEQHSVRLIKTLISLAERMQKSPQTQELLLSGIRSLREKYEGDSAGRALVLSTLELTDERIAQILNERITQKLEELSGGEGEDYARLKAGTEMFCRRLANDPSWQEMLDRWQGEFIGRLDFGSYLASWLDSNLRGENPFWLKTLEDFIDRKTDEFAERKSWQKRFDLMVKNFLQEELTKHHDVVEKLIRERLAEFSDEALTEFVESRVADDLQMIRINGSLVGALVGMGLFIIVWAAERMWSL